jgi:HPt (histidine-containing phosphotransfer) domain-containing protein
MSDDPTNGGQATAPIRSEFADDEDMAELVEFFVGEMNDRIASLEAAASSGDLTQLATLAHQLKGAAGGYGFPGVSDVAGALEKAVKYDARPIDDVKAEIDELIGICRRVSM